MPILPKKVVLNISDYPLAAEGRRGKIRLDSGENTAGFPELYPSKLEPISVSSYPEYDVLLSKLAGLWNLSVDQLLLCNGSDNGLALIAETFIEPNVDEAVASDPSFVVILRSLELSGAKLNRVAVKHDLSFDIEGIERALARKPKLAMFASPDNPTGAMLPNGVMEKWCKTFPDTLFVMDEAYFDFSRVTVIDKVNSYANLLVTRTFSKAWAMAGLRLGVIVGHADLIRYMRRVRLPFDVNGVAVDAALKVLEHPAEIEASARITMEHKRALVAGLNSQGIKLIDGTANFFLLDMGARAAEFTSFCHERGVLVRNCSQGNLGYPLFGKIRISTGTADENIALLEIIEAFSKVAQKC